MTTKIKAAAAARADKDAAHAAQAPRIDYVPLDEVQRWPRNSKRHDTETLGQSIERFGFVQPLMLDETSGRIVAGHGRLETLIGMYDNGQSPPARVTVDAKGRWLVPVIRGVGFKSEAEAEAYLLADNRLVEVGGWDNAELLEQLKTLSFSDALHGVGFFAVDIDRIERDMRRMALQIERSAATIGQPQDVADDQPTAPSDPGDPGDAPAQPSERRPVTIEPPAGSSRAEPLAVDAAPAGKVRIVMECDKAFFDSTARAVLADWYKSGMAMAISDGGV